jgi:hypothetical protein
MDKLETDFTSTWPARPWDYEDNRLNAHLVESTDNIPGTSTLVFDNKSLVYPGNGLTPDISSLGEQEDRPFTITHKIYMTTAPSHPAIQMDERIIITQEQDISPSTPVLADNGLPILNDDGVPIFEEDAPFGPIFKSYDKHCGKDFRSGYPADIGRFEVDATTVDYTRGGTGETELGDGLGVPPTRMSGGRGSFGSTGRTPAVSALFTCGSQILVSEADVEYRWYAPFRLDCDCLHYPCTTESSVLGPTEYTPSLTDINSCLLPHYLQPDGTYDYNADQLEINYKAVLQEQITVCDKKLNGEIGNLLCVKVQGLTAPIQDTGSYLYKDAYGIIYEASWTFINNILDITSITKSPRVWGISDELGPGYIKEGKLYRKGTITETRQVIRKIGTQYEILSTWFNQYVDFFVENRICGEKQFEDNFCFHCDCAVSSDFRAITISGPRWVLPGDKNIVWPNLGSAGTAEITNTFEPFEFISIWQK